MSSSQPQKSPLKILFIAAEVAPFASVGGLSQVLSYLPKALLAKGLDVRVILPKYGLIDENNYKIQMSLSGLKVPTTPGDNGKFLTCNIKTTQLRKTDPIIYFVENMEYYEKRSNVYGYDDDHIRFALLSRATIEFLRKSSWIPNIIHANDWHAGYLINDLRSAYGDEKLKSIAVLMTVHNLYQGRFDFRQASVIDFDDGKGPLPDFFDANFQKKSPLKRGVIYADAVNTVSENHAAEITTEQFGEGLHNLFREIRVKLFGILNGIDHASWNPETDTLIAANFSSRTPGKRAENKKDLQKIFHLDQDPMIPLLGFVGRLHSQKGIELLRTVLPRVLAERRAQFVMVGTGDRGYREFFEKLESQFPGQVGTHLMANFTIPRKIYAGADMMLIPSKWEPGGIVAMEAMRYGSIPVAHATGGLADIVNDYNPADRTGTGFTFSNFDETSFLLALTRAMETYRRPDEWKDLMIRCLRQDYSWNHAAEEYLKLYRHTLALHENAQDE